MERKILVLCISAIITLLLSATAIITTYLYTTFDDDKIFEDNINKVVEIRISNDNINFAYGTGCFIDNSGTILTNKHLVYNESLSALYSIVQVRLPTEADFIDAEILKTSNNSDLATIKINKNNTQYFKIDTNIKNGQTIYTIGNPNGFGLSFCKGNVSSKLRNIIYNGELVETIQTSLVINEGNSGGPVFDKKGHLLGLVSFRMKNSSLEVMQGVSFAVPAFKITEFLNTI